jgi:hypothetical protein
LVESGPGSEWQAATTADPGFWRVLPVLDQCQEVIVGGLLMPSGSRAFAPVHDPDQDPATAQQEAALAMAVALDLLTRMPEPLWLAIAIPNAGLLSARGFFRALATWLPADMVALRQRIGRRLILVQSIEPRAPEPSAALLASLAEWHALAAFWTGVPVRVMASPAARRWQRVFAGPPLVAGIDVDLDLQRQWMFLSRGLAALSIPVVAIGADTVSERSWLRRQGCEAITESRQLCGVESFLEQVSP